MNRFIWIIVSLVIYVINIRPHFFEEIEGYKFVTLCNKCIYSIYDLQRTCLGYF